MEEYELTSINRLAEVIASLKPTSAIFDDAYNAFDETSGMLGFNSFTYVGGRLIAGHRVSGWERGKRPINITNINDEFKSGYSRNRMDKHDPILKYSMHTAFPNCWSHVKSHHPVTREEKKFLAFSYDFDMNDGVTFPVHGPGDDYGILSFSSKKNVCLPGFHC